MVVQPFWILEMWANFAFFNSLYARVGSMVFPVTRCIEPLVR